MAKDVTKPPQKNRYRKIEVRMWGDEKFRNLSPLQPSGQGLWVFLLTGPHTGPIPGLFRAGRAAMAEELDWDVEAFEEAFGEVFQQGMAKADWKAKVVWIPNAIHCNRPESPNVVLSWGGEWDLIPECDLKREAYEALKASIYALGEGFAKAFDKAFGKPSEKPSTKPTGKTCPNQEQEQEQEQEQDKRSNPDGLLVDSDPADDFVLGEGGGKATRPDCPHQEIIALYHEILPMCPSIREWKGARQANLRTRWNEDPKRQNLDYWRTFFTYVAESKFLTGRAKTQEGRKPFLASLDWIVKAENFTKIREERYHNEESAP
ncbi:hypothetical protein [Cupriavidus nantongensis]|uniref:Uncharacterized protein n=1 Tax=Cupriavidus nantongensis TaxID=1796606 RepID=A0A142JHT9_9BURK|nr:hypothetical protein [Cupriavidus nantongensis]AMR77651.1 hypothetical protein A2G96_07835 [Cupriavidus nantongensis]